VNLYGFAGNDGVNRWDYLGYLVIELISDYLDGNGSPKSADEIWKQLHQGGNAIYKGKNVKIEPPLRHDPNMDRNKGGAVKQHNEADVFYDSSDDSRCSLKGEINHFVFSLVMNTSKTRKKVFSNDYWGTAHHEVKHIQSRLRRLQNIVDIASDWPSEFETPEVAERARKGYQMLLDQMLIDATEKEGDHDQDGGFGTPREGTPEPGWGGWMPGDK